MAKLQPVRGTRDILGEDARRFAAVVDCFRRIAERFNFAEISTPVFEFSDVFRKTLGDVSDVVSKEMYSFEDRGGEEITLRPEFTAGIARAYLSGGLQQHGVCKFYAYGPMFRYERPQKGRYRQFHQLDVEIIGAAEPGADIDVIAVGQALLVGLGIADQVKLHLNSLGDPDDRARYRESLVGYFRVHEDRLSEDSRDRLNRNPLRILDSKDAGDREVIREAPRFSEFLSTESRDFFAKVREGLEILGIGYQIDETLVRGLDYYTHTAFEFITDALGAQGTVIGGGRYDGLIEAMGGPPTPGVGWAAGIERLAMLLPEPEAPARPVAIVPLGEAAEAKALSLASELRAAGLKVDLAYRGNLRRRMQQANRIDASHAVILGDDELDRGVAQVKDLDSGDQRECSLDRLAHELRGATGDD